MLLNYCLGTSLIIDLRSGRCCCGENMIGSLSCYGRSDVFIMQRSITAKKGNCGIGVS